MTPEHLHLAVNHLPILGLGFAIIPLLIGIFKNNRVTIFSGLLIAMIGGWATPLAMESGEQAIERYEKGSVTAYLDANVGPVLETHEERAEAGAKAMLAAAVLATISFLLNFWKPVWARRISVVVVIACVISVAFGLWIADAGGKIRRVDFRADDRASIANSN